MSTFGERLTRLREEKGYTGTYVAEQIGVDTSNISKWELGSRDNPTSTVLIKLSDFFNCSIDYLLGRTEDIQSLTDTVMRLFESFDREQQLLAVEKLMQIKMMKK